MSRTHLTALAMLLVAATAAPTEAQAPTPPPTDSVAKDSVAPKKSRFGSLRDKAKAVAGNKTVQKIANNETVKGAAMGVACTVVPGAAVVSAATGQGPCANSGLMAGLMNGRGMAGLGALTGLSNAAATATAMKMIKNGNAFGMNNVASAAAAAKMMQTNGLSNAAALAAMKDAGMSAGDMAAAMKMMQTNSAEVATAMKIFQTGAPQLMPAGNPGAANTGSGGAAATATAPAPAAGLFVNYDFVPGERVIYYADFTDDQVGNFPERLTFVEGNMEVAELGGRRVLRATTQSKLTIPLPEALPQRFTIEIDVINRPSLDGTDFHLRGSVGRIDDASTSIIAWGSDGLQMLGGGGGEVRLSNNEGNRLRYRGKPAQLRILGDGKYVKVYLDEKRVANVPNANFARTNTLHLVIDARSENNAAFVSRIRVAESRKSLYDDIAANGRAATQGLLFDTGSDRLRPESTPTLKAIAAMLEQHPELKLRIEGHTDNVGAKDANKTLSEKRAAAVKAALIADYHVSGNRLESKGFGDSKPAGANTTAEGRSNNRRVELVKM
jgi:outer membrane protein OmpA-like peptidoglycan-associated protein